MYQSLFFMLIFFISSVHCMQPNIDTARDDTKSRTTSSTASNRRKRKHSATLVTTPIVHGRPHAANDDDSSHKKYKKKQTTPFRVATTCENDAAIKKITLDQVSRLISRIAYARCALRSYERKHIEQSYLPFIKHGASIISPEFYCKLRVVKSYRPVSESESSDDEKIISLPVFAIQHSLVDTLKELLVQSEKSSLISPWLGPNQKDTLFDIATQQYRANPTPDRLQACALTRDYLKKYQSRLLEGKKKINFLAGSESDDNDDVSDVETTESLNNAMENVFI